MNKIIKSNKKLFLYAAMDALAGITRADDVYTSCEGGRVMTGRAPRKPSERVKALYRETKTLREFKVKGKTILAYSKKDATKRFNHQKEEEL